MLSGIWRSVASATALAVSICTFGVGIAWADPLGAKFERHATLDCPGASLSVVVNGAGKWLPAHDLNSTTIFVPIQFLGESGVFIDPSGVPHPFSEPAGPPKGSANPEGRAVVDCTFTVDTTFPDGSSVIANGAVRGFLSS